MAFTTVFDASRQSDVTTLVLPLALGVGALVLATSRVRSRLPYGLGIVLPIAVVLFAILMAFAPMVRRVTVANDWRSKHYSVTEGPITEYTRSMNGAGGFRSGHFTVQRQQFSMPNHVITQGFDNQGDAIEVGHVVRITHDGDMILRVEMQQ